jgi:hypothetical protein
MHSLLWNVSKVQTAATQMSNKTDHQTLKFLKDKIIFIFVILYLYETYYMNIT